MIDSHCHLADEAFEADLEDVIGRAQDAGVTGALCVLDVTIEAEARRADRVAAGWPGVRFATGVHPHHAGEFESRLGELEPNVRSAIEGRPHTCAVGEIGLDYHYDFASRELQREVFRRQIRLAQMMTRPIVIHTREAEEDTFAILTEASQDGPISGVFHCFTGDAAMATRAVALGFHVSFSGIATFKRADSVRQASAVVPWDRLLVETDAPYLAPVPYRGRRNEPAWVVSVADTLADVKGVTLDEVCTRTAATFEALFTVGRSPAKGLSR